MKQVYLIELGMGIDQHGQDAIVAPVRAVEDATTSDLMIVINAAVKVGY
jgi:uncharacterized protein (TIGR02058 family)